MSDLTRAAARWGVEPGYHDVSGRWHDASPLALRELTAALSAGRAAPAVSPPARDVVAWQCGERRMWGLAVQLYALRSARNWGHGDFGDLAALVETVAPLGCSAIGLNPLHALFPDRAEDASPYSPSSRQFLNPLYIDLNAVGEFPGLAALGLEAQVSALRAADMVQYAGVARAKIAALRACHARLRDASDARRRDFEDFQDEQGEDLVRFAAFEVLRQRFGGTAWWDWPEGWQRPGKAQIAQLCAEQADEIGFHMYVQWLAEEQLRGCQQLARRRGMPVGLYIDLAVGVDPAGADSWTGQGEMLSGVSVGAPPDALQSGGPELGTDEFQSARLERHGLCADPPAAAGGHAPCRRDPHRSRAGPDAAVPHSARGGRRGRRLCALSVRRAARGRRGRERQGAMHRGRRRPRHGPGRDFATRSRATGSGPTW